MIAQADMDRERLSKGIRRQIAGESNKRFLRNLNCFRASNTLPAEFERLLDRLAEQEGMPTRRHH